METLSDERLRELYDGHTPLSEVVDGLTLSRWHRIELAFIVTLVGAVRPLYWLVRRLLGRPFVSAADVADELHDETPARGIGRAAERGRPYLTDAEVEEYESRAVLGPFRVLSADEAAAFREWLVAAHEADWHGRHPTGETAVAELKENGLWAINHGALWQERNFQRIRDVARHPELAARAASLLGDDVVAWRCQVFEVAAGRKGTFWHSATTFTEDGDLPALTPPPGIPDAMVNVSAWIALEDVDRKNGCLRLVPGSHHDVRLDALIRRFSSDRVGLVMSLDRSARRTAVMALRYTGDVFLAAQVAFDQAMAMIPDLYAEAAPAEYPMKAGECILFSSNNLHGSHANKTDQNRLAFGVRLTSADVGVYEGQATFPYATGSGTTTVDATGLQHGIPVHTTDGPVAQGQ